MLIQYNHIIYTLCIKKLFQLYFCDKFVDLMPIFTITLSLNWAICAQTYQKIAHYILTASSLYLIRQSFTKNT